MLAPNFKGKNQGWIPLLKEVNQNIFYLLEPNKLRGDKNFHLFNVSHSQPFSPFSRDFQSYLSSKIKKKILQKKAPKIIFFKLFVLNKTKEMPLGFNWFRKIIVFSVSV